MIRPRDNVGFGTVLGYFTVAELQDLVAAKDVEMRNLARAFNEVAGLPYDFTRFIPAYQALVARYQVARNAAQKAIQAAVGAWRPTNLIVADQEYSDVLTAINPRWRENTWSPGDGSFEDISDQLKKFGATGKGDEPIPQPSKGADVDIAAYQQSGKALQSVRNLVDTKHLLLYALVGGVLVAFVAPRLLGMTPAGLIARRF